MCQPSLSRSQNEMTRDLGDLKYIPPKFYALYSTLTLLKITEVTIFDARIVGSDLILQILLSGIGRHAFTDGTDLCIKLT